MILTADELAMVEAVSGGMQVEILFGEWPRKEAILTQMLAECQRVEANPVDQKQYLVAGMRRYYCETVLQKHQETAQQRPNGEPMELMCPKVGHWTIGSRARTAITIDARLTL